MGSGNLNSTRILIEHKFTRVNVRNKVSQNPFNEYTLNTIKLHIPAGIPGILLFHMFYSLMYLVSRHCEGFEISVKAS